MENRSKRVPHNEKVTWSKGLEEKREQGLVTFLGIVFQTNREQEQRLGDVMHLESVTRALILH